MNEGMGQRLDGGKIFAIEEINVEGHQCGQCYCRSAEHSGRRMKCAGCQYVNPQCCVAATYRCGFCCNRTRVCGGLALIYSSVAGHGGAGATVSNNRQNAITKVLCCHKKEPRAVYALGVRH